MLLGSRLRLPTPVSGQLIQRVVVDLSSGGLQGPFGSKEIRGSHRLTFPFMLAWMTPAARRAAELG